MTDEEKKAIEFIKSELQDEKVRDDYQMITGLYGNLEIEILLNLFEKQSKEIEELKKDNKEYIDLHYVPYEQYVSKLNGLDKKWIDKIKAKIEYNKVFNDDIHKYAVLTLEELLEKE